MTDTNLYYAGLGIFLQTTIVVGAGLLASKLAPKHTALIKWLVGIALGGVMILFAKFGVPAASDVKMKVLQLLPYAALSACAFLGLRLWLSGRAFERKVLAALRDHAGLIDENGKALATVGSLADAELARVRADLVDLVMEKQGQISRLDAKVAHQSPLSEAGFRPLFPLVEKLLRAALTEEGHPIARALAGIGASIGDLDPSPQPPDRPGEHRRPHRLVPVEQRHGPGFRRHHRHSGRLGLQEPLRRDAVAPGTAGDYLQAFSPRSPLAPLRTSPGSVFQPAP